MQGILPPTLRGFFSILEFSPSTWAVLFAQGILPLTLRVFFSVRWDAWTAAPRTHRLFTRNFMDMVATLPALKLDRLSENSFICEAILRLLPPLGKKYVLQLLYINGPVTAKLLEEWVLPDGVSKQKVAIDRYVQLRVLSETLDRRWHGLIQSGRKDL